MSFRLELGICQKALIAGDSTPNDLSDTDLELSKSTDVGKSWSFVSSIARGGQNGNVYVWNDYHEMMNGGVTAADSVFSTQTGAGYTRDILPLPNGMLLITNSGGVQPHRSNAIRVETIDANDIAKSGKVIVHYVDQNGKAIQPDYVSSGIIGSPYDVLSKVGTTISGYTFIGVTTNKNNLKGNFGADPIEITAIYQTATANNSGNNGASSTGTGAAETTATETIQSAASQLTGSQLESQGNNANKEVTLPQTGNDTNRLSIVGLAAASLLGLFGLGKRDRKYN